LNFLQRKIAGSPAGQFGFVIVEASHVLAAFFGD